MPSRSPHFRNSGDERLRDLERRSGAGERGVLLEYALELRDQGGAHDAVLDAIQAAIAAGIPGARLELARQLERGGSDPVGVLAVVGDAMAAGDPGAVAEFALRASEIPMELFERAYDHEIGAVPHDVYRLPEDWRRDRFRELFNDRVAKPFASAVQRLRLLAYLGDADARRFLQKDFVGYIEPQKMEFLPARTGTFGTIRPFKDLGPKVAQALGGATAARLALAAVEAVRPFAELHEYVPGKGETHVTAEALDSALDAGRRVIQAFVARSAHNSGPNARRRQENVDALLRELEAAAAQAVASLRGLPNFAEPETPELDNRMVASRLAAIAVRKFVESLFESSGTGRAVLYETATAARVPRVIYATEAAMAWKAQLEEEGFMGPSRVGRFRPWAFYQGVPLPDDKEKWLKKGRARIKAAMLRTARAFIL